MGEEVDICVHLLAMIMYLSAYRGWWLHNKFCEASQ